MASNTHAPAGDDPAISAPVMEMITVANEYCLFFERTPSYVRTDILQYFQKIAPLLYLKGSLLPATEADESALERFVSEEQWEAVFKPLREHLGADDIYYTYDHNFDPVEASIAENIADIYQEMKDFVMLYQKNTHPARQAAVWQLRDLFGGRWGPALLQALAAVHHILFRADIDPGLFQSDQDWLI